MSRMWLVAIAIDSLDRGHHSRRFFGVTLSSSDLFKIYTRSWHSLLETSADFTAPCNKIRTFYSDLRSPTWSGPDPPVQTHLTSLPSLVTSHLGFLFVQHKELVLSLGPVQEFTPWVPSAWNACLPSPNKTNSLCWWLLLAIWISQCITTTSEAFLDPPNLSSHSVTLM